MKKLFTFILGMGAMLCANAQNPFAYGLTSGTPVSPNKGLITVDVTYSLNADADEVKALIMNENGEVVKTLALEGITKGEYETTLDLSGIGMGEFTWAIEVKGGATSGNPVNFKTWSFYHPCGLDVDNSTESPSFGTIFVAEGYTNGITSGYVSAQADGTEGSGLYMFTPALESIADKNKDLRFYPSFLTHSHKYYTSSSAGADFSKVAVADDGRIFVSRHNNLGDYILVAESVESLKNGGEFTSLLSGKTMTDATIYNDANGNFLAGPTQAMDVKGGGEDTKILVIARNANSIDYSYSINRAKEYNVGNGVTLETANSYPALDGKYTISYDKGVNVAYDNRGGVWYCQYRGTPSDAQPALVYFDADGELRYFEGFGGKARNRGAVAVSPDAMRLVASSASGTLAVYDIVYATDGDVTLSEVSSVSPGGNSMFAATWDCAGNFYCGNASKEYVKGYAVPRANNVFATKAPSKYSLVIDSTVSIDGIDTDADAPVEYYNLQGVKVENPEKGIFIKRQGSKTTKVVL
ncbi:MAG: hypothetical protein IJ328_04255 [Muribaculaceae bacterium]|nr:hypothetical protein [Muribaculaceae bacterium]